MNEKLNYCAHMVELIKTDLHERRSHRLEVLIVLLISIEVRRLGHFKNVPHLDNSGNFLGCLRGGASIYSAKDPRRPCGRGVCKAQLAWDVHSMKALDCGLHDCN